MKIRYLLAIMATLCLLGGSALAQTPPPKHHGMLGMFGRHQHGKTGQHQPSAMGGSIIGNKNTHVYHMPGDKNLPDPKNRVYFHTEAEAQKAGYHRSGSGHGAPQGTKGGHTSGTHGGKTGGQTPAHP